MFLRGRHYEARRSYRKNFHSLFYLVLLELIQCGPVSIEAIRRDDIGSAYDSSPVLAERMHQGEDNDLRFSRRKLNEYHVGRTLLTILSDESEELGEKDERDVLDEDRSGDNGSREKREAYYERKKGDIEDVSFDLTEIEAISIGNPFTVQLIIHNESRGKRTIKVALSAHSICYTGVQHSEIKKADSRIELMPMNRQEIVMTIDYKEYWKYLRGQCMMKMYAIARVKETGQSWTDEDDFQVESPPLTIEAPKEMKRGESREVLVRFTNPLDMDLTECQLSIDDAADHRLIELTHCVNANGKFVYKFLFTPRTAGTKKGSVSFNSKELFEVNGSFVIEVKE